MLLIQAESITASDWYRGKKIKFTKDNFNVISDYSQTKAVESWCVFIF